MNARPQHTELERAYDVLALSHGERPEGETVRSLFATYTALQNALRVHTHMMRERGQVKAAELLSGCARAIDTEGADALRRCVAQQAATP